MSIFPTVLQDLDNITSNPALLTAMDIADTLKENSRKVISVVGDDYTAELLLLGGAVLTMDVYDSQFGFSLTFEGDHARISDGLDLTDVSMTQVAVYLMGLVGIPYGPVA